MLYQEPFLVLGLAPSYGTVFIFIFRTNCTIAFGARAYMLQGFCGCRAGEMAFKIPEMFYVFGPQLNALTSVGILLKYFRRNLLQFE